MGRALQKSTAPRRLAVVAALATGLGLAAAGCSAGQITQTDQQMAAVNGASGEAGAIAVRDAQLPFPAAHGAYEEGDDAPVVVLIANNGADADKLLAVTSESAEPAEISGDQLLEPASAVLGEADQEDAGSHSTTTTPRPSGSSSADPTSGTSVTGSGSATTTTTPSSAPAASSASSPSASSAGSATTTTGSGTSISAPPTRSTKIPSSVDPTEPGTVRIVLKGLKKAVRPGETVKVTFLFEKSGEVTLELSIGATAEPRKGGAAEH